MSSEIWDEIIDEYKLARNCLWCPKHCGYWERKENEGYYHLWRAYHLATSCEIKQPLWYARILYMMASEQQYKQSDYVVLNTYLKPCMEAYAKAEEMNEKVSSKERETAEYLYKLYLHKQIHTCSTEENYAAAYSRIEGLPVYTEFQFHDSKVLGFAHDTSSARLTLQYEKTIITLLFEDVDEIKMFADEVDIMGISDFYCYPSYNSDTRIIFDIGFYRIGCRKIKVLR